MFLGLDLYSTDPAQHLRTAGQGLDDLDRNLSDLSVRRVDDPDRDLSVRRVDDPDRTLSDLSVRRVDDPDRDLSDLPVRRVHRWLTVSPH